MDRRSLLIGLGAVTLSQGITGCRQNPAVSLQIEVLSRSLPSQLVSKFKDSIKANAKLNLALHTSPVELFTALQQRALAGPDKSSRSERAWWPPDFGSLWGGPPPTVSRLASLGDYWLQAAITQKLIQPWSAEQLSGWQNLGPQWQRLVKRDRQGNLSEKGEIWGAPYRWGATMIAFRKDKFRDLGWTPTDWADLWRPELRQQISLLNQPREVIGLTLKKLQQSYNTANLNAISNLPAELQALNRQVKFYSSTDYLQPLLLGDTWAAVGWSTDILPLLVEDAEIAAIVPRSGTALWSDLWVSPAQTARAETLERQWVEFWWQPEIAAALSQFTNAVSPALQAKSGQDVSTDLLRPDHPWFKHSEYLEPLSPATTAQYRTLWKQMLA